VAVEGIATQPPDDQHLSQRQCTWTVKSVSPLQSVFLRGQDLFSENTVAIDGSKFRAQNSKKNNYNEKKIKDQLNYIDGQAEKYPERNGATRYP